MFYTSHLQLLLKLLDITWIAADSRRRGEKEAEEKGRGKKKKRKKPNQDKAGSNSLAKRPKPEREREIHAEDRQVAFTACGRIPKQVTSSANSDSSELSAAS